MDEHLHTNECLNYAATTGTAHCIAECRDSRSLWDEVFEERGRQDKKWGDQRTITDLRWLGILAEEVGEAADAVLDDRPEQMREEVIQACASALAWLECIDRADPIRDRHANAAVLRVIARDLERGMVEPDIAKLPRVNFLRRLARHMTEN